MLFASLIPLFGIAIPMIIVPAALYAKHVGRVRQYRHLEQMQALKAGVTLPPTVPLPGPFSLVAIGAGVPMACLLGAFAATESMRHQLPYNTAALTIVWGACAVVGLGALATTLALGLLLHRANARAAAMARDSSAKPAYDPDMFDPAHRAY
jgi:hypothetical protein